jgi:hypothetical protein
MAPLNSSKTHQRIPFIPSMVVFYSHSRRINTTTLHLRLKDDTASEVKKKTQSYEL